MYSVSNQCNFITEWPLLRLEVKKKIKTRENNSCHRPSCQRPTSELQVGPHVNSRIPQDDHRPHLNNLGRYVHDLCKKYHLRFMRWNHMMTQNRWHHRRRPRWWHRLCGDMCHYWWKIRRWRRRSRLVIHKSAGAGYALHDRVGWVAQENCVFLNYAADAKPSGR